MRSIILSIIVVSLVVLLSSCSDKKSGETQKETNNTPAGSATSPASIKTIVFFGNSLTAGYGLEPSEAYPSLIQKKIDSLDLSYKVVNAGVSGETTASGNTRVDWILKQPVDVFVLELGANDGLRGIPVEETRKNLQSIIEKVKAKNPAVKIVLAGMQVPPNMGQQYATEFGAIYPQLAKQNEVTLIPFLLKNVGGEARLNQEDGIHPSAEGTVIVAENVWEELEDVLR